MHVTIITHKQIVLVYPGLKLWRSDLPGAIQNERFFIQFEKKVKEYMFISSSLYIFMFC